MVSPTIPRWLTKLDESQPYIEVLDGERQPDVSPYFPHGTLALRIGAQVDAWAGDRGNVGAEVRFYLQHADGTWSSVLPDVAYSSFARLPREPRDRWERPRIAPDLAVEILSPDDRPARTRRKVALYLEFGSTVVLVLEPRGRCVTLYRCDGTVEEREARGAGELPPFERLVFDWDVIYRNVG